jgi:hypothetical protein
MSSALDAEGGLAGLEPGTTVGIEHLQLSTGGPFHNRSFRELMRLGKIGLDNCRLAKRIAPSRKPVRRRH